MAKHTHPYVRWTPEEDAILRNGGTPPNRTSTQCYTRARKLGIPRSSRTWKHWSHDDVAMLRRGVLPEGRTPSAAYNYCMLHGIPPIPTWRPYLCHIPEWTPEELESVRSGHVPPGRTTKQCIYVARNILHTDFVPTVLPPLSDEDANAIQAIRLSNDGIPMSTIASVLGVPLHDLRNWVVNLRRTVLRKAKAKTKACHEP